MNVDMKDIDFKKEEKTMCSFRLSRDTIEMLEELSISIGATKTSIIEKLIKKAYEGSGKKKLGRTISDCRK